MVNCFFLLLFHEKLSLYIKPFIWSEKTPRWPQSIHKKEILSEMIFKICEICQKKNPLNQTIGSEIDMENIDGSILHIGKTIAVCNTCWFGKILSLTEHDGG